MSNESKFEAAVDQLAQAAARGTKKLYPIPKKRAENILKVLRKAKTAGVLPVPAKTEKSVPGRRGDGSFTRFDRHAVVAISKQEEVSERSSVESASKRTAHTVPTSKKTRRAIKPSPKGGAKKQ